MPIPLFTTPSILRLGLGLSVGFSAAAATLHPISPFHATPMQCQYSAPYYRPESQSQVNPESGWAVDSNDPILRKQGRTRVSGQGQRSSRFLNARTARQISLGSILGVVAGVGLRAFSRVLVVLLGVGVVLIEWAAWKGYSILPRMQKYVKNVDLRRAMAEQRPFKMSFGVTMALAAIGHF